MKHTETMHFHAIAQLTDAQLNAIAAQNVGSVGDDVIEGTFERVDDRGKPG